MTIVIVHAKNAWEAAQQVPWAKIIAKSGDTWIAFESIADFEKFQAEQLQRENHTQPQLP